MKSLVHSLQKRNCYHDFKQFMNRKVDFLNGLMDSSHVLEVMHKMAIVVLSPGNGFIKTIETDTLKVILFVLFEFAVPCDKDSSDRDLACPDHAISLSHAIGMAKPL